jgi:hypothetical protein
MPDYIYLIREREFLKTGELIYKIGRSKQIGCKRINDYPRGSSLECIFKVDNCIDKEREIIKLFSEKFNRKKDIGNEYFEGDRNEMLKYMFEICKEIDFKNETYNIEELKDINEEKKEEKKILNEELNKMKSKLEIEKIKVVLEKKIKKLHEKRIKKLNEEKDLVIEFVKKNIINKIGKRVKIKDIYNRYNQDLNIQNFTKYIKEENIYNITKYRNINIIKDYELI